MAHPPLDQAQVLRRRLEETTRDQMCIRDSRYTASAPAWTAAWRASGDPAGASSSMGYPSSPAGLEGSAGGCLGAVSYTHLDVYKRQEIGLPLLCPAGDGGRQAGKRP